jgi:sn-1 stearoyl-lipid 9-desaturase
MYIGYVGINDKYDTTKSQGYRMRFLQSSTQGSQVFQLSCVVGGIGALATTSLTPTHLGLIVLGYFLYGCLGVVVGFHRYLTHRGFDLSPVVIKILSVLGCLGGTGSPIAWIAIHINHHLRSDKPSDPHSPLHKGIKIFALDYENEVDSNTKWRMRDIVTNPFQQILHRYYFLVLLSWGVILFVLGGFELVAFLFLIPALITAIMSNVVNYVGHSPSWIGGYRTFNINDRSSNNWLWALPSWGESWHNNHHRYPKNYSFSQKWWEIDIAGMIIKAIRRK